MTTQRLHSQFGNYRLLSLLGQGGFSEVYLGEHIYLKTQAAIKILTMRLEQNELAHFLAEARTIAHLEHPHIVRVLDFGLEGKKPFLVLAYAPHGSMRERYPRGSVLALAEVAQYARQIAAALQYAHTQNLIHGDVKPENILIGRNEELLLSDFGVAVIASHSTQRDDISGTVAYMAPEQLRGEPCFASDQYSLGVVIYEWLCGARPFSGSFTEIALHHMQTTPPSLRERIPLLPVAVEQVVMKALAKDARQRFGSITDFVHAFELACPASTASENSTIALQSGQPAEQETASPVPTNVPYHRNPYFTGRADALERLATLLRDGEGQPVAICGLGGMGKTQLALEYIYRHQNAYSAILWARAESYETFFADFVAIAREMQLVEANKTEAQQAVAAVTRWLATHNDWLLVLDNIEDYSLMQRFVLPTSQGHMLLTTRAQASGTYAQSLVLEKLTPEEGARLLLRRSKRTGLGNSTHRTLDSEADFIEAQDICKMLDGLPLALDAAGAYIEESGCSLYHYIERYREQRAMLLRLRGTSSELHPESVSATVLLALEKVEQPGAIELLKLCTFLRVDSIDEEILAEASSFMDDSSVNEGEPGRLPETDAGVPGRGQAPPVPYTALGRQSLLAGEALRLFRDSDGYLDTLIAGLRKYSLINRQGDERTLSLHRLVQAVVKDAMETGEQRVWAERALQAVSQVFPDAEKVVDWPFCERLMPQVYVCLGHIDEWQLVSPVAVGLLERAGRYLLEQGQYDQATHLLGRALHMREAIGTPDALALMETLNNLASCYLFKGEYGKAEPLFARVLTLCEEMYGVPHVDVAVTLNNLALLYQQQGRYSDAERCLHRALATWEQLNEQEHVDMARTLNNLALLYHRQGRLSEAEPLYRRGLSIWETQYGRTHPDLAVQLNNLAALYQQQGRYAQAEPLYQRVLEIREKALGPEHPVVAHSLICLAHSYQHQWRYAEAEALLQQALSIRKHALGPEHPEIAHSLIHLAKLYFSLGKHTQAEPLYQQALSIRENALGPEHPDVAALLKNYAVLLMGMKRKDEAVQLAARARSIRAKAHI